MCFFGIYFILFWGVGCNQHNRGVPTTTRAHRGVRRCVPTPRHIPKGLCTLHPPLPPKSSRWDEARGPRQRLVQFVTSRPECTLCYQWPPASAAGPDVIYNPRSGPAASCARRSGRYLRRFPPRTGCRREPQTLPPSLNALTLASCLIIIRVFNFFFPPGGGRTSAMCASCGRGKAVPVGAAGRKRRRPRGWGH